MIEQLNWKWQTHCLRADTGRWTLDVWASTLGNPDFSTERKHHYIVTVYIYGDDGVSAYTKQHLSNHTLAQSLRALDHLWSNVALRAILAEACGVDLGLAQTEEKL